MIYYPLKFDGHIIIPFAKERELIYNDKQAVPGYFFYVCENIFESVQ